ncbi:ScbR family autoregulator-binding transcription factor [Streptomyces sp. NPDC127038]|uniref:ScbR family autoregulator-binding transcription factor n=1 Tax=Streptomyces sp. NPDC127038 TaxID=3347114 RepID=UPI00365D0E7B
MVKQARAARTREALIVAAAEVFADNGYALASLPAVSRRAGVSTGALHFHFASKEALAREVEGAAADFVGELAAGCRGAGDTLLGSLVDTTRLLLAAVGSDPVVRAGFKLSRDPSRKESGGGLVRWWCEWVRDLLAQAAEEGELARGVCSEDAAAAVVAATVGLETLGDWDLEWVSPERAARLWAFLLPLLTASPQQPHPHPGLEPGPGLGSGGAGEPAGPGRRPEQTQPGGRPGPEGHPEHPERPEHPEHPERAEPGDRTGRRTGAGPPGGRAPVRDCGAGNV